MGMLAYRLFVPSNASLESLTSARDDISDRVPFGYFSSVSSTLGVFAAASGTAQDLTITVPMAPGTNFATPTVPIIQISALEDNEGFMAIANIIKNTFRVFIGMLVFGFIAYEIWSHRVIKE